MKAENGPGIIMKRQRECIKKGERVMINAYRSIIRDFGILEQTYSGHNDLRRPNINQAKKIMENRLFDN